MRFEWDEAKRIANLAKHRVDFVLVEHFDFEDAVVFADSRQDYGEERMTALGSIGSRLHVLIFTWRSEIVRVISLRKANAREVKFYEQQKA
jgi:uncharacterized DUF497 family protein